MIGAYFKLVSLSDEVRATNKINSKTRLDCVSSAELISGSSNGLTIFVNTKRQLFFYKTAPRGFVNTDSKRIAEWCLTNSSLNMSSIYIEDIDFPHYAYGYPNAKRMLKNGTENPQFNFRNDGYLFILNRDYSEIEVLLIPNGRNLISSYYQILIDGGFDETIKKLRSEAQPFHKYEGHLL